MATDAEKKAADEAAKKAAVEAEEKGKNATKGILLMEVKHDGAVYKAGSKCPDNLISTFTKAGYVK